MITTYLIKFAEDGTRESTIPVDSTLTDERNAELIADGYDEIPALEWQEYCNGKIRGKDGKPTDAPAYVPSKEEQLAQLDSQYNADKAELTQYFAEAVLADDTETQSELRQELEDLNADYIARRKEIEENIND